MLDRYQDVVVFTMSGFDYYEHFNVQKSLITHKPVGVNFIVGSMTPNTRHMTDDVKKIAGKNPTFNVVTLNPWTFVPEEYETYEFNLD